MIDALFSQNSYATAKKMLDASALRQEALASNIANLETPGYKRIDLAPSFNEELTRALGTGNGAAIAAVRPSLAIDTTAVSNTLDGNTVQLENELLKLSENSLAHSVGVQLVSGKLLQLRLAITGRPS